MLSLEEIRQAQERTKAWVHRTPIFSSATFSRIAGNEVYLKAENLQKAEPLSSEGL